MTKGAKNGKTKCPQCNSWADGITSILEDKLRDEWEDWEYATEIAQAWCLISKLNTEEKQPSSPCKEKLCNFFYFWLGGTLCHRLKPSTWFQDTMQEIYTKLKGSNVQCEYIPIDGTIDRDLFKYRKIIFDYYYDYKTLKEQLKYPPSEVSPCKVKYDAYLQDVEDAHKQVEANCGRTSKDEYCNNFWNKFKNSNIPKPPDLKSNIMNGEDITEDGTDVLRCLTQLSSAITELSRQEETSASLGTISSTAISSALGTVGVAALPIVAFLSYKYNLLPLWLRNKFGGTNKGKGRSTARRHHFDDILTNDDTSTIGSTTIGSKVGDSTEVSTIYSRPPRRKNAHIREQQHQQRKGTIISYHTMQH